MELSVGIVFRNSVVTDHSSVPNLFIYQAVFYYNIFIFFLRFLFYVS